MNTPRRQEIRISAASENPYDTPKANAHVLAGEPDSKTPAHLTFRALAWVLWAALVVSVLWDLIGLLSQGPLGPNPVSNGRIEPCPLLGLKVTGHEGAQGVDGLSVATSI